MIKYSRVKKIYFIGIGGSGMSGIAEVLHNMGFTISGSDMSDSESVKRLKRLGINVNLGHERGNVTGMETVVYSSAIKMDNVEMQDAVEMKIPLIPRAEMLAELMRMKYSIAVAGTHGKTSATSMIASVLSHGDEDPTYVVGGCLKTEESGAKLGSSTCLIAEADESDGSFVRLFPTISVVTNIEDDHLDYYKTMDNLLQGFEDFCNRVPFYGSVVLNSDCKESRKIGEKLRKRVVWYGLSDNADVRAENVEFSPFKCTYDLIFRGKSSGRVELNVGGIHNVYNSLAAISASLEFGMEISVIIEGLSRFFLPRRRFQVLYHDKNRTVIDDYAHHPTEVKATLKTMKSGNFKRIIAVFQPHRFTRLKNLMEEFAESFSDADKVVLSQVYSANQIAIENINSAVLKEKISRKSGVDTEYTEDFDQLIEKLAADVRDGDGIVFLSAGNLSQYAHKFASMLGEKK